MKNKKLILIHGLFFSSIIFLAFLISAIAINSTSYSGVFTQGSSNGNITNISQSGASAGFYQQPIGNLNDSLYSGIYSFTSQIFTPIGLIINPQNETYITRINVPINFTLDNNVNSVIYNIDGGSNTTLTGNSTFNSTNGLHTFLLFVNNSEGTTSRSVTFTVNESQFLIHYNNFSNSTKGQSTNFNASTYEDLQNLTDVILENTNYGKIKFNTGINLTNDSIPGDSDLDLDSYVQISNSSISINSTALPNLNKSATLYLYNLSFTDPRVLKDGVVCSSSICTEINYSGGTFVFNVTEFSNYSTEETPAGSQTPPDAGSGGGGGGGSGAAVSTSLFVLDRNQISVSLTPGQIKTEELTITNNGNQVLVVSINNLFEDFVLSEDESIVLNPKESKKILINVIAKAGTVPDLYLGKLILSSGSSKRELLIAVEVEESGVLLDVRAEIQREQKRILAGEQILAEIRLFNLGAPSERKDVLIEYSIRDSQNKEIAKETESLAIETQASFVKRMNIPEGSPTGVYILYVRATYEGKVASASDNFEIVTSKVTRREKVYISTIVILSVILSLVVYLTALHRRRTLRVGSKREDRRVDIRKIMRR